MHTLCHHGVMTTERSTPIKKLLAGWIPPVPGDLGEQLAQADADLIAAQAHMQKHEADHGQAALGVERALLIRNLLIALSTQGPQGVAANMRSIKASRVSQLRSQQLTGLDPTLEEYIRQARSVREQRRALRAAEARSRGSLSQKDLLAQEADPEGRLSPRERRQLGEQLFAKAMAEKGRRGAASRWKALLREVDPTNTMPVQLRIETAKVLRHQRMVAPGGEHTTVTAAGDDGTFHATCSCGWPTLPKRECRNAWQRLEREVDPDGTMPVGLRHALADGVRHCRKSGGTHETVVVRDPNGQLRAVCSCGWPTGSRPTLRQRLEDQIDPDGVMPARERTARLIGARHRYDAELSAIRAAQRMQPPGDGPLLDHIVEVVLPLEGPAGVTCSCGWEVVNP